MLKRSIALILLLHFIPCANTAHNTWDKLDDPIRRGAWVWKPNDPGVNKWDGIPGWQQIYNNYQGAADLIIDFLNSKSIRIIYLYSGCWEWEETYFKTAAGGNPGLYNESGLANFINKAQNYSMKVHALFYLYDDPNTISPYTDAARYIVDAVVGYNERHPAAMLAGLQCDQEPYNTGVYDEYLDCMQQMHNRIAYWRGQSSPGSAHLVLTAALKPQWVVSDPDITFNSATKPMYQHCLDIMDGATVMAYRDTAGQALFRCTDVIDYGTSLNKPVSIGQETGWHNASGNVTYAEEIQAENDSTRFNYMEGEFAAIYNQVTNKPGFERIVIHDIPQYFCWFFNNQTPAAFLDGGGTWTYTDPLDLGQDDSYWADWPENSSNFSSSQAASSAGSSGIPASSAASSAAGLRPAPAVKLNSHILDITASQTVVFYFMDKEENMLTASTGRFKLYDQLGNLLLDWQMENTDLNSGTFSWDGSGADLKHPGIYLFQIKFDQTKLIGSLVVKTSG